MKTTPEWPALIAGNVSVEEAQPLFSSVASQLESFLRANQNGDRLVLDVIGKRLGGKIDRDTMKSLDRALTDTIGPDTAALLRWIMAANQGERLKEFEKSADQRVTSLLRTIIALYGPEFENAIYRDLTFANDWQTLTKEIFYDAYRRIWRLQLRIEKNNGDEFFIDSPADSFMRFTRSILNTIAAVPNPEAFSGKTVDDFLESTRAVVKFLRPQPEEAAAAAGADLLPSRSRGQ